MFYSLLCFFDVAVILFFQIGWHDLAFFDPMLYESLRKLLTEAESPNADDIFRGLDLTFSVQATAEEGGGQVELVKGGKHVAVIPSNVYDYVRLYAEQRMLGNSKKALQVSSSHCKCDFDRKPGKRKESLLTKPVLYEILVDHTIFRRYYFIFKTFSLLIKLQPM